MSSIPGSARTVRSDELVGAHKVGELQDVADTIIQVTLVLRPGAGADAARPENLTRVALRAAQRPDLRDLEEVVSFARESNLTVVDLDRPPRMVVLKGTVRDIARAFGAEIEAWEQLWPWPSEQVSQRLDQQQQPFPFRLRQDVELQVPDDLDGIVQGVFGIDNRKEARMQMHMQMWMQMWMRDGEDANDSIPPDQPETYTVRQLAEIYDFPVAEDEGHGQTIAVLSLGGRLDREGLARYCGNLKVPEVVEVPVDRELPELGAMPYEDAEVALDVYIIAALVPSARIVIYYAENTSQGFLNGLARAIYSDDLRASIISISWGMYEESWTGQAMCAIDQLLADAKDLDITVCCASGDMGSSDGAPDGLLHVDFPASSPHVLSCGGTMLTPNPANQAELDEIVWSEPGVVFFGSGGGESAVFGKPDWQQGRPVLAAFKKRGVPDVAGFADSRNGFLIPVSGRDVIVGGTSAVAPLWAGLIARINENLKCQIGYLNPRLYDVGEKAFRDITKGDNDGWRAGAGWDACTGRGSPRGNVLLLALREQLRRSSAE
jgi:kumamolisin